MERRARAAMSATLAISLSVAPGIANAQDLMPASLDAGASGTLDAGISLSLSEPLDAGVDASESLTLEQPQAELSPAVAVPASAAAVTASDVGPVPAAATVDVTVRSGSKAQRQRESAAAVTVVELKSAKKQAADLGAVLARVQGISVRRTAGLGSAMRFSLNGLTDDQIRFFLDEVPLKLAGYSQQIGDVPLLTLERVDVYRGVVPIRFGADALGGVVNLVTPQPTRGSGGDGYYQIGSFGTHRAGLSGYHVHAPSGLFTRLSVYGDLTQNDYEVDVTVPDASGRPQPVRARRFHDKYRAVGGAFEIGVVKRPWAERLVLRAFGMKMAGDIQTDPIMSVAYGEARYSEANYGATLRYDQSFAKRFRIEAVAGYSFSPIEFVDQGRYFYNWHGERVRLRPRPGETGSDNAHPYGYDQTVHQQASFARALLQAKLHEGHRIELTLTPTYTTRTGEDRAGQESVRARFSAKHTMFSLVSGVAYVANELDDRIENVLFAKHFLYGTGMERTQASETSLSRFGAGDALRVRITPTLYTKASYELTTRLPRPEEVFGNGVQIEANLGLKPETSHNGNLELTLEHPSERAGTWRASANGFVRAVDQQIILPPSGSRQSYQNVDTARALGTEGSAGWTSPGDYLLLDANFTYVDFRNTSSQGIYGMYKGDRLPSRPYLFANTTARGQLRNLLHVGDEIALWYYFHYIHEFYRSWESFGAGETKDVIPKQITHTVSLVYSIRVLKFDLSGAFEVDNLSDATVFDQFGAQKPGRAYYFKLAFSR